MVNVIQKDNHALTLPVKKKQNPHIKRNAMHAYITYMIYTDMAHEQQQVETEPKKTCRTL